MKPARKSEHHLGSRVGWLRAAVLGANDGIVSTASLVLGVAAAGATERVVLMTAVSGLIAGAMSMAAGEYVSVHSQQDTEDADIRQERAELRADPAGETLELAGLYQARGLAAPLALQVAQQLMAKDALAAHKRDELGLSSELQARPLQAAMASACSFAVGAALPMGLVMVAPVAQITAWVSVASLVFLAGLGVVSAYAGGAPQGRGALRVAFWGAAAMAVTAAAGALFGATTT